MPPISRAAPVLAALFALSACQQQPGAREKAATMGFKGALYPWESADKGVETTPPYGFAGDLAIECRVPHGPIGDLNVMTRRGRWS